MFLFKLAIAPVYCLFEGFVLKVLWGWYLIPLGFPKISMITAVGISLIIDMLCVPQYPNMDDRIKNQNERLMLFLLVRLIVPTFSLIFGWIFHFFL
jgi:hypothetical protein